MFDHPRVIKIIDFGSIKIAGIAAITTLQAEFEGNRLGTLKKATNINPQSLYEGLWEFLHDIHNPNPQFLRQQNHCLYWKKIRYCFGKNITIGLLIINLIVAYQLTSIIRPK